MRYLGIDYGTKRVGVAFSDEEGRIAFPHAVLANDKNLITALQNLCAEKQIGDIVVGESRTLSGAPNTIAEKIDAFKKDIGETTQLSVHYEPEFWTSQQAERWQLRRPDTTIRRGSESRPKRREAIKKLDASAAAIILQSFLDRQNNQ